MRLPPELVEGVSISTLAAPAGANGHWGQVALVPRDASAVEGAAGAAVVGGELEIWLEVRPGEAFLDGGWAAA